MSWKSLSLPDAAVAANGIGKVQDAFESLFMAAGCPSGMGLLMNNDVSSEATELYLSPGSLPYCKPLLASWSWRDCARPAAGDVSMLVAAESIESLLSK